MSRLLATAIAVSFVIASVPAAAGELVIQWVSGKQQPNQYQPYLNREEAIAKLGRKAGEMVWQALQAQRAKTPLVPAFQVMVANTDTERPAVAAELRLTYLDAKGAALSETTTTYQINLRPGMADQLTIGCVEAFCDAAEKLEVAVVNATFGHPKARLHLAENERELRWKGRRWFLEDSWESRRAIELRTFAKAAYDSKPFDGKVFPADKVASDESRFYRVGREPIPAQHFAEPDNVDWGYIESTIAGIKIRDGRKVKPSFLETVSNINADCELKPGDFVRIRKVLAGKKNLDLVIALVCRTIPRHRSVRAYLRIAAGNAIMRNLDSETAGELVRPWLEPVSIAEVAKRCGPNSGTLVKRWTPETTQADVERQFGAADVEAETGDGHLLVYGELKLTFSGGALAGIGWRPKK